MENISTPVYNATVSTAFYESENGSFDWHFYIWTSLFWLITIVGTIGNSVVIWIVIAHKNMRTVTNIFLLNLSVADGLLSSLNIPFVSYQVMNNDWIFGHTICKLNEFIAATSICVSVLTLSMIAIDRYSAIMHPFRLRMGRGKTITNVIGMWIVSIVVTSPNWMYVTTGESNGSKFCGQLWPENSPETLYRVVFMILTYFLPLLCMTYSYGRMALVLWGSTTIGQNSENQLNKEMAKKRVVKMMITIVVIFTICWLPFHLFFIVSATGVADHFKFANEVYLAAFWLAMSNSMYNPIVYCWMNARFRAGFKKAFRWCPFVRYDPAVDGVHFISKSERNPISSGGV